MAHDPETHCLWLTGGRTGDDVLDGHSVPKDMWKFDLKTSRWEKINGKHLDIYSNPHGIHNGRWYIVRVDVQPSEVVSFDLRKHGYTTHKITNPVRPYFSDQACASWVQDGSLVAWGVDSADQVRGGEIKVTLWILDLKNPKLAWEPRAIMGESDTILKMEGTESLVFSEACASYDPITKKAYIYGGWREDFNWYSVDPNTSSVGVLQGRFNCTLLEVDVAGNRIRAVEPQETSGRRVGPSFRAMSAMGAYGGRLVVTAGRSTLDDIEQTYAGTKALKDTHMCRIGAGAGAGAGSGSGSLSEQCSEPLVALAAEMPPPAPVSAPASAPAPAPTPVHVATPAPAPALAPAPKQQSQSQLEPTAAAAAPPAPRVGTVSPMAPMAPTLIPNPIANSNCTDIQEVVICARNAVLSDEYLRLYITELAPQSRGVLIGLVEDDVTMMPREVRDIFKDLHWKGIDEWTEMFPYVANNGYRDAVLKYDPHAFVSIFFYCIVVPGYVDENAQGNIFHYERYRKDHTYTSESAHSRAGPALCVSASPAADKANGFNGVKDRCENPTCPSKLLLLIYYT
jgi:hypothetical protein